MMKDSMKTDGCDSDLKEDFKSLELIDVRFSGEFSLDQVLSIVSNATEVQKLLHGRKIKKTKLTIEYLHRARLLMEAMGHTDKAYIRIEDSEDDADSEDDETVVSVALDEECHVDMIFKVSS